MFWLILSALTSAMVSIMMRMSESKRKNNISMLAVNYITCTFLSLIITGGGFLIRRTDGNTLMLGMAAGILFLSSFLLLQRNIQHCGVVLSSLFMKLGVMVPIAVSMLFFGEMPSAVQAAGMGLAVAGIVLLSGCGSAKTAGFAGLIVLLLVGGLTDSMSKIFEQLGDPSKSSIYLLYTFGTALILCVILAAVKGQRLSLPDVLFGLLIGVPNYFTSWFFLKSLQTVPAVIAYPVCCLGAMALITLAGCVLFREMLNRRQLTAMGVISAALVLMNI